MSTTIGRPLVRSPGSRVEALAGLRIAAAGRDDLALLEEIVGDGDRLVEQAARVVAQVEHEPDQLVAGLLLQVLDRVAQAEVGLLVEAGDPHIADIALEMRAHRLDLDDGARQRHVERVGGRRARW